MTVVEPLVAFVLGYIVLGEKFQIEGWEYAYMAAAIAVMTISTVILSRKSIDEEEASAAGGANHTATETAANAGATGAETAAS